MPVYNIDHPAPWSELINETTGIDIGNGVTSISVAAFRDFSNVTSVSISETVTSIDALAFYSCAKLTSVTIPASVTFIGLSAFRGCSEITSIAVKRQYCHSHNKFFCRYYNGNSPEVGNG